MQRLHCGVSGRVCSDTLFAQVWLQRILQWCASAFLFWGGMWQRMRLGLPTLGRSLPIVSVGLSSWNGNPVWCGGPSKDDLAAIKSKTEAMFPIGLG